jgi:hypothetical protein
MKTHKELTDYLIANKRKLTGHARNGILGRTSYDFAVLLHTTHTELELSHAQILACVDTYIGKLNFPAISIPTQNTP